MDQQTILKLCKEGTFENEALNAELIETHISWVLLTDSFAFKIKKPVQLSFLDFSTKEAREYYCQQEIELNSRFTDIYINTLPILQSEDKLTIDGEEGMVIDYAVQMIRLEEDKRMDKMAVGGKITEPLLTTLAKTISDFHQKPK